MDTVERFQGGQRDTIIISFGVGDPDLIADEESFLLQLERTNVAISRARAKCVVVISEDLAYHLPSDRETIQTSKAVKAYVSDSADRPAGAGHYSRWRQQNPYHSLARITAVRFRNRALRSPRISLCRPCGRPVVYLMQRIQLCAHHKASNQCRDCSNDDFMISLASRFRDGIAPNRTCIRPPSDKPVADLIPYTRQGFRERIRALMR